MVMDRFAILCWKIWGRLVLCKLHYLSIYFKKPLAWFSFSFWKEKDGVYKCHASPLRSLTGKIWRMKSGRQAEWDITKMLHGAISLVSLTGKILLSTNNEKTCVNVFLCLVQKWKRTGHHSITFLFRSVLGFIVPCRFETNTTNTSSELSDCLVPKGDLYAQFILTTLIWTSNLMYMLSLT